jgi:hypothetical protein
MKLYFTALKIYGLQVWLGSLRIVKYRKRSRCHLFEKHRATYFIIFVRSKRFLLSQYKTQDSQPDYITWCIIK